MPIRIEQRLRPSRVLPWLTPLLAIVATILASAAIFAAMGHAPGPVLTAFFVAPLLSSDSLAELALKAGPLVMIAVGLAAGFRANVWNIGAEGQLILGAIAGGGVALACWGEDGWWILPAMCLAGLLGGMAWGAIPAFLRTRLGVNEILTSLMLTYVAGLLLTTLVFGQWKDPEGFNFPQSRMFSDAETLPPLIEGTRLTAGTVFAFVVPVVAWAVLRYSMAGLQTRALGLAPAAAGYAGFSANRIVWMVMLASSGLAGLAGVFEIAGPIGQLIPQITPGYGFTAIIVAFLGRLHPLPVVMGAHMGNVPAAVPSHDEGCMAARDPGRLLPTESPVFPSGRGCVAVARAGGLLLLIVAALAGCKEERQAEPPPPPKVVVAPPTARKITHYLETTGSAAAVNTVDLVARVQGFLQEQSYTDGQMVKRGATLFTIEPGPFQAQLQQAQAEQKAAESHLAYTTAEYNRQAELARNDFAARSALDQARADRDSDEASVEQKRAATQASAITYAYTHVTAPFDGIATAHLVSVGNLVGGNAKLASVVQLDPVYVNFSVSEQDAQRIHADLASRGLTLAELGTVPVEVGLQTEVGYPHAGRLDYVNPGFDPATGTLAARAVFENKDRALLPGSFVRVRVPRQRDVQALLVPDTALGADQGGDYLLVVDGQDTVQQRHVVTGAEVESLREIVSGLGPADRVVISGTQRAVPGQKVQPVTQVAGAVSDGG